MRTITFAPLGLWLLFACGGAAPAPFTALSAAAGPAPTPVSVPTAEVIPKAVDASLVQSVSAPTEMDAYRIVPKNAPDLTVFNRAIHVKGLAAEPAQCARFHHQKIGSITCPSKDPAAYFASVVGAASKTSTDATDTALASLTGCGLSAAYVLALRAEFAPPECADVLIESSSEHAASQPSVAHVLAAHAISGKLRRAVQPAPLLSAPYTKERVNAFLIGPFATWFRDTSTAIQELSAAGALLLGYARGMVGVEAGMADLHLAELIRKAPMPESFKNDPELIGIYTSALEDLLEPRKQRGKAAALVGLRALRDEGDIKSRRVSEVRALLATMYAGRRIDALDALMIPNPVAGGSGVTAAPLVPVEALTQLPAYYINELALTSAPAVLQTPLLDALAASASPPQFPELFRRRFADPRTPQTRVIDTNGAYDYLLLGRTYWDRSSFTRAAVLAKNTLVSSDESKRAPHDLEEFYVALAETLVNGPENATAMMAAASPGALRVSSTEKLDALAAAKGRYAGEAAFDAALLREIAVPDGAKADYFQDLATRFRAAGATLPKPQKVIAEAHAKQALLVGQAIK